MSSTMLERVADEQAGPGQANVSRLPQDMATELTNSEPDPPAHCEWMKPNSFTECCCLYVYVCLSWWVFLDTCIHMDVSLCRSHSPLFSLGWLAKEPQSVPCLHCWGHWLMKQLCGNAGVPNSGHLKHFTQQGALSPGPRAILLSQIHLFKWAST